jgi:hypothetical protein
MTLAYCITAGRDLFNWRIREPRGVLYLDGEMPASLMRERFAHIVAAFDAEPKAPLRIITPDLQPNGTPDLATITGQKAVNAAMHDDIDIIMADNLSALVRYGDENVAADWLPVQDWLLRLRARGKSAVLLHHAGKAGAQRGTSRREDILDSVLALKRSPDHTSVDGAHFELHYDKLRGAAGTHAEPLDVQLRADAAGKWIWTQRSLEQSTADKVAKLIAEGYSQKEVAIELGIDKSRVSRHAKKARDVGLR